MANIFISYSRKDAAIAKVFAGALQAEGWSVWWDVSIRTGETYPKAIARQLEGADCVMVLWSRASVDSDWVQVEAGEAAARKVLVPVMIEEVAPPLQFRLIQAVHLVGWKGDKSFPEYLRLRTDISCVLEGKPRQVAPASVVDPKRDEFPRPLQRFAAVG